MLLESKPVKSGSLKCSILLWEKNNNKKPRNHSQNKRNKISVQCLLNFLLVYSLLKKFVTCLSTSQLYVFTVPCSYLFLWYVVTASNWTVFKCLQICIVVTTWYLDMRKIFKQCCLQFKSIQGLLVLHLLVLERCNSNVEFLCSISSHLGAWGCFFHGAQSVCLA